MKWKPTPWSHAKVTWQESAKYWRGVPAGAFALLLSGIACLFATFGVLTGLLDADKAPLSSALIVALESAIFSAGLAWAGFRAHFKWMVAIIVLQFITLLFISRLPGHKVATLTTSPADYAVLQQRIRIEAVTAMVCVIVGYTLFVAFMRKEGLRVFGPLTEMKLAKEVHRTLVPPLMLSTGAFEIHGSSVPSGEMGGDLVDVIENHRGWLAYLADVSGHGVPAGMIMAMVKSAARMGTAAGVDAAALMGGLNRVLASSCSPNTFVTFACMAGDGTGRVQFSLAGHLPILHYRRQMKMVEEHSVPNLPLGVLPDAKFETASIDCQPGDVLAVLTDGLTEVSGGDGHELGLEPLKSLLHDFAREPLPDLMAALRDCAQGYGKQFDDQTVLLIRYKG